MSEDILSKAIDRIFMLKKKTVYLTLIIFFGFIFRALYALRARFYADEMVHGTHAIGFIGSGKLQIMDQSAIWFWLTDLSMKIFGANIFGIRLIAILLGSMSIIAVYLLGKELFSERTGIIASLIAALSIYQLEMTNSGADVGMTFFTLLAVYFFIVFSKNQNKKYFYLVWVAIAIAVMTKPIAAAFFISIFLCSFFYHFKKQKSVGLKEYFFAAIIMALIFLPVFTFNYLLYQDKGILDLQFARFTRISIETYASIAPTIESFNPSSLIFTIPAYGKPATLQALSFIYDRELLVVVLFAIIGLVYTFKDKIRYRLLLSITFLIPFLFLAGTSLLPNHFVFTSFYVALFSAFGIEKLLTLISKPSNRKKIIVLLVLFLVGVMYFKVSASEANGFFGQKNELGKLIDFKNEKIGKDSLVIADSRIYTGRSVFMLWDRNYIAAGDFLSFLNSPEVATSQTIPVETYFLECVQDDCGWGGEQVKGALNESMELLTAEFQRLGQIEQTIYDVHGKEYFRVYKGNLNLNAGIIPFAKSTHVWFYYPVNYEKSMSSFDDYTTNNPFEKFLDLFAHVVLYLDILIAIILTGYSVKLLLKDNA